MEFFIITGLSGSGKSRAVDAMEDIGINCVDNVPPSLIPTFINLFSSTQQGYSKVAIVTDIRSGNLFSELYATIKDLSEKQVSLKILFLDADNQTLQQRFKETRRRHPLLNECGGILSDAIEREREMLASIREISDFIIDTSDITPAQLKERISKLLLGNVKEGISIHCTSFGFKYGGAHDADTVFDVRCLPNPFYVAELRDKTGLDKPVYDYVMQNPQAVDFEKKLFDMLDFLLPLYVQEGKCQLVIAFGCTGGKHRSVTFAEETYKHLSEKGYHVSISHRDIKKV